MADCYKCFRELTSEEIFYDLFYEGDGPHCEACWNEKWNKELDERSEEDNG